MSTKCAGCGQVVYFAEQIKALDKYWHKRCLKCITCAKVLALGSFSENNGNPYCKSCYASVHGPKGYGFGTPGGGLSVGVSGSAVGGPKSSTTGPTPVTSYIAPKPAPKPTSSASSGTNYDELERLASLRDKGILTEAEFQAKKRQILGL
eukprot:GEZU01010212.1.p2 GENE.GEZU01010212.1~~GEZU01010212.1.p2  ORF type:complete len:168 (-),score=38.31 GEZU01010212.1:834-1283(-)